MSTRPCKKLTEPQPEMLVAVVENHVAVLRACPSAKPMSNPHFMRLRATLLLSGWLSGCSDSATGNDDPSDPVGGAGAGNPEGGGGAGIPGAEPGYQLGTDENRSIGELKRAGSQDREATDLGFNPVRPNELWVVLREFASDAPCTESVPQGCPALESRIGLYEDAVSEPDSVKTRQDQNAWHFMRRATSIAFGEDDTFATVAEYRTGNYDDDPVDYIGPSWWSSDPEIFAKPSGLNGSHIDMLHASPFAMGVAFEVGTTYWVFNGDARSIDKYVFNDPHVPGGDDHSDGEIYRYVRGDIKRSEGIPSHMVFDARDKSLYICDTGNGRIAKLDTGSGVTGADFEMYDPLDVHVLMKDATLTDVVPPGKLEAPSGIELAGDALFITDNATSKIHAFDLEGNELAIFDTKLPPKTLSGIALGPDDKLYFTDMLTGLVRRIDRE